MPFSTAKSPEAKQLLNSLALSFFKKSKPKRAGEARQTHYKSSFTSRQLAIDALRHPRVLLTWV
jgi:hypothetical protein